MLKGKIKIYQLLSLERSRNSFKGANCLNSNIWLSSLLSIATPVFTGFIPALSVVTYVKAQIKEPCAMSLELLLLVKSGVFYFFLFFMTHRWPEQLCFCSVFSPFSQVGNSRLHGSFI